MNAIILSAIGGIVMMMCSITVKNRNAFRHIAALGFLVVLIANIMETYGMRFFHIDTKGMLHFDKFGLFFNTIAIASTLILILLNGRDVVKMGKYSPDYFALDILCCMWGNYTFQLQ